MKCLVFLCVLLSFAAARAPYQFSDGYLDILGAEPTESFTCDDKPYGYYADTANNCEVFHVCVPINDETGAVIDMHHYSFFCGNQTVFNQESLTCVHQGDGIPCAEAEAFYEASNADFGKIPDDNEPLEKRK